MEDQLKEIKIEDYDELNKYYNLRRPETADSNLLDLFLWENSYPTWYFTNEYGLMWVAKSGKGQYYSSVPCCKDKDLKKCFLATQKYFNQVLKKKLTMYLVDKKAIETLELPEKDYKKKNHLNSFKRDYEGRYEFRLLSKKNQQEILEFLDIWKDNKSDSEEHEFIESEAKGIRFILEHENIFNYKIGGVYIDDRLEAFCIGNYYEQEDMVYLPVEKANPEIRGLYQYICSQFFITAFPGAGKENREDDMGLEGLRKSKLSYNPIYMVEKYTIIQK